MRHHVVVVVLVGLMIAGVSWHATAQSLDPDTIKQPIATPEINLGKMNYQAFCQECHGVNAAGTDKGPSFLHKVYHPGHHGDASFYRAALNGARAHHWPFGDMKPVEGIKEAQVEKIITYVRAIQKANGIW